VGQAKQLQVGQFFGHIESVSKKVAT